MPFVSLSEMVKKDRIQRPKGKHYWHLDIFTISQVKVEKGDKSILVFNLGVHFMESVNLEMGDRVDVFYDADKQMGLIKKANSGGYLLSNRTGGKVRNKSRAQFTVVWKQGMPTINDPLVIYKPLTLIDNGFTFKFCPEVDKPKFRKIQDSDLKFSDVQAISSSQ